MPNERAHVAWQANRPSSDRCIPKAIQRPPVECRKLSRGCGPQRSEFHRARRPCITTRTTARKMDRVCLAAAEKRIHRDATRPRALPRNKIARKRNKPLGNSRDGFLNPPKPLAFYITYTFRRVYALRQAAAACRRTCFPTDPAAGRLELVSDFPGQFGHAIAVAPLIVVPRDELEEIPIQLDRGAGVEDRRMPVVNEVR